MINKTLTISFIRVLAMAIQFAFNMTLARNFGASGVGEYYVFMALVTGLATLSKFGSDINGIKLLGRLDFSNSAKKQKGYWLQLAKLSFVATLGVICVWLLYTSFGVLEETVQKFKALAVLALVGQVGLIFGTSCLRGLKRPVSASVLESLLLPLLNLTGLFFILTLDVASVYYIAIVYSLLLLLLSLLTHGYLFYLFVGEDFELPSESISSLAKASLPLVGIALMTYMTSWSTLWVVEYFYDSTEVGVYNICWRLILVAGFVSLAIKNIYAPYFAQYFEKNKIDELQLMARKACGLLFGVSLPFLLLLFFFSEYVLGLFGKEFILGVNLLKIMVVAQLVNTFFGPVGYLLLMTNNSQALNKINFVSSGSTLILSIILIRLYGLEGAGVAYLTGLLLHNLASWWVVKNKVGVSCVPFDFSKRL